MPRSEREERKPVKEDSRAMALASHCGIILFGRYANARVRSTDMVKGQAFVTAAYALGCSAGNFAGGQLLNFGVDALLIAGIVMTGIGTLIVFATATKTDFTEDPCKRIQLPLHMT